MEFIQVILKIVAPPLFLSLLLYILPPYLLFKTLSFIVRSMCSENVAGKVILITGASSGIGEHLAYEYGRRRARLALVARRENRLKEVATTAISLGSPDVITIPADVSKVHDCKRFVDLTINHFGRLDHLVNNAGIVPLSLFEDIPDITNFAPAMASKAAVISLYESLRTELGRDIGITIVSPGLIESEMTQGKFLSKEGRMVLDQEMRDVQVSLVPVRSVTEAAKAIVNSACRGDPSLTEPAWIRITFYWKNRWLLMSGSSERDTISKKLLDLTNLKTYLYPESIRNPKHKPNK